MSWRSSSGACSKSGIRRCLRTRHQIYTFLDEVVGSHPTLITALAQRDKALAKQILSDHVAESVTHILANWPPEEDAVPPVTIPVPNGAPAGL